MTLHPILVWLAYLPNKLSEKWPRFGDFNEVPEQTDLCTVFWRTLLVPPFFIVGMLLVVILGTLLSPFILIVWCIIKLCEKGEDSVRVAAAVMVVKSWKRKFCPLIQIKK